MDASRVQGASLRRKTLHSVLSYKRLERGRFRIPALLRPGDKTIALDAHEFTRILEGLDLPRSRVSVGITAVRRPGSPASP
jgi:hypothetical protein